MVAVVSGCMGKLTLYAGCRTHIRNSGTGRTQFVVVQLTTCSHSYAKEETCDSKGPVLLQASAGGGRWVSSCRSSNAGHVRPPATPPIWAEWAGAKTRTFEQHTGCTWQSMLAICHSVHTCTPRHARTAMQKKKHATAKALFCCKHRQAAVGGSHRAGLQTPGM